jgi:DNA-binding SARP family transcriptional activator
VSDASRLELRFLGEMEVLRGTRRLELPPSRKTRALLAYLALTGRSHRRDRLCSLLWDVADDPRGALRWSLSRLRALVDEPERQRIRGPRDSIAFEAQGARIDVLALRESCAAGLDALPLPELERLASEFRGELLEGLDLSDFLDFQAWCVAEREAARKLHARVLRTLVERLSDDAEAALPHARAHAGIDPLDEGVRARLLLLLGTTGRAREAEQQYAAACRIRRELGRSASAELEEAWRRVRAQSAAATSITPSEAAVPRSAHTAAALVGRKREFARLAQALAGVREGGARVVLVLGEPGLGKSRLVEELGRMVGAAAGSLLEGRAFEAEAGRPFGPWIDALRQLPPEAVAGLADLATLLPGHAPSDRAPSSRDRLFAAVAELLAARAASAPPVVLAFEDAHWLDAASAELLHYLARTSREQPLLVLLTAREGELFDNEAALRALRGLRELGLVEELALAPLDVDETRDLVREVGAEIDAERVFAESGGNPLLALELARSLPQPDAAPSRSLCELIRRRVERLPSEAGDVLRWAAVLGRGFSADRLGQLMALELDRLLAALELLERHALLRTREAEPSRYEFSHDIVQRALYAELSQPRRRLMHQRVAERLSHEQAGDLGAAELAHHASLAGDDVLAARAFAAAGRRSLRQFANEDARALARLGRHHATAVEEPERTRLVLELLQVELQARRPPDLSAVSSEVKGFAERALSQGSAEHARLGFHMLAYLSFEAGDFAEAQDQMLRAEAASRTGDETAQVVAMAEAARCLVLLERDLPRAEALVLEASARSAKAGVRPAAISDAKGMLHQHRDELDAAAALFEQARLEARRADDPMDEFQALEHLTVLRQQQGRWQEARQLADALVALGAKLREGSEAPFARALLALSDHALGDPHAARALDAAVEELRLSDAKLRLAYTLTRAARIDLLRGDAVRAQQRAHEARGTVAVLGRPSETLLAGVTMVRACREAGDAREAERVRQELEAGSFGGASAFAIRELAELRRSP